MSIRVKLMAIVSAIILLSLGLLTYFSLNIFEEDMTNILTDMNSRTNKLLSEKVNTELNNYRQQMLLFDRLYREGNQPEDRLMQMVWQDKDNIFYFLSLLPGSGQQWHSAYALTNPKPLKQKDLNVKELTQAAGTMARLIQQHPNNKIYIKNISHQYQKLVWLLAVPRLKKTGDSYKIERILLTYLDLSELSQVLGKAGSSGELRSTYNSFLVDDEGKLVLHPSREAMLKVEARKNHPIVQKIFNAKTQSGLIRYQKEQDNKAKEYFGAYSKLPKLNLSLATNIEAKHALEGVYIARIRALLISLLILSVAILFIYFFSKTLSEPIKQLALATQEIIKGHFGAKIPKKSEDEIGDLTEAFNSMSTGLEEREKLKGALGKFVNKEIAQRALNGDLSLGGERKEGTIFFSDIRSFTSISESLEPEEVVEFLNEYMTLMVEIIYKTGGVVDKFIGDAIMALWGIPVSKGNDIVNCLDASLEMRQRLIAFNQKRYKQNKPEIKIGCGINSGPVVAGQIGSEDRLEYTVIGDTVNLASRIEALNKPFGTDILITEYTYNEIKELYSCVAMDKIKVKGKAKPLQIYAVLGHKDDPNTPKNITALRKLIGTKPENPKGGKGSSQGAEEKYEILEK